MVLFNTERQSGKVGEKKAPFFLHEHRRFKLAALVVQAVLLTKSELDSTHCGRRVSGSIKKRHIVCKNIFKKKAERVEVDSRSSTTKVTI